MPNDDPDLAAELAELTVAEVRALLEVTLPLPAHSSASRQAWSLWRRHKRWQSRQSYCGRAGQDTRRSPPSHGDHIRLYY